MDEAKADSDVVVAVWEELGNSSPISALQPCCHRADESQGSVILLAAEFSTCMMVSAAQNTELWCKAQALLMWSGASQGKVWEARIHLHGSKSLHWAHGKI